MGQGKPLRLVFMGTPALAATVLERVLGWEGGRVVGVYCQPDRPAGRGMALTPPPVKILAAGRGIPVFQPCNFKNAADVDTLRALAPDYLLVAAYGLILPQRVLDIPSRHSLNVHTSLLPRYRGAAPIQRAVMNGDTETGVTIMVMDAGLDTGPIVLQKKAAISQGMTAGALHDVLALYGGELLITALEGLEDGLLIPNPQDHSNATYAPKLAKHDGAVTFTATATAIDSLVRGVTPWPGAVAILEREEVESIPVGILMGRPFEGALPAAAHSLNPGDVLPGLVEKALAVRTDDGLYLIFSLKPAGRKALDAEAFYNGYLKGRARFLTLPDGSS